MHSVVPLHRVIVLRTLFNNPGRDERSDERKTTLLQVDPTSCQKTQSDTMKEQKTTVDQSTAESAQTVAQERREC